MAGPRQPIELIVANGRKHLTKEEIENRRSTEVQPCTDEIEPPSFLTAKQKRKFDKLSDQLLKLRIMGETDVDALARYIIAQDEYERECRELRKLAKERPKKEDGLEFFYVKLAKWNEAMKATTARQDTFFKQAEKAAASMGLTISSRCRLVVPVIEEKPKENKFAKFGKAAGGK